MNTSQLNTQLNTLIHKHHPINEEAKVVFNILANSKPDNPTTVDSILEGTHFARSQVIQILKTFETAGWGVFKNGRRQFPSRFIWKSNKAQTAVDAKAVEPITEKTVLEGPRIAAKAVAPKKVKRGRKPGTLNKNTKGETKRHSFALSPTFTVSMVLPRKLTQSEGRRLIDYILFLIQ